MSVALLRTLQSGVMRSRLLAARGFARQHARWRAEGGGSQCPEASLPPNESVWEELSREMSGVTRTRLRELAGGESVGEEGQLRMCRLDPCTDRRLEYVFDPFYSTRDLLSVQLLSFFLCILDRWTLGAEMDISAMQRLAPPAVTALVFFLAYSSQGLFFYIEPGPLQRGDAYFFNAFVACLLICYWRACFADPGKIPKNWDEKLAEGSRQGDHASLRQRWCRKCEAYKPPRAHHCKTCQRCVLKMDHHCVWTANCVSHLTWPSFIRFLFYAVTAMIQLEYFLFQRCSILWAKRHLPSYLGPSIFQLVHMFILVVTNSVVLFALILLLARTIWCLAFNMTTIEGWEIERHETLLRRARVLGGYLTGPDGSKVRIERQEFPWDVGIWSNLCQGMGSKNPIAWFWPLAKMPSIESGLSFEHNGIDDPDLPWPPPDPDRLFRTPRAPATGSGFTQSMEIEDFRKRQEADLARYADADGEYVVRRRPFHERLEDMQKAGGVVDDDDENAVVSTDDDMSEAGEDAVSNKRAPITGDAAGEEAWRNKEGERLADFGVDEVADFYDEDDIPLAELIRRRQALP